MIKPIILKDEKIIECFRNVRDGIIFTSNRIIAINIKGMTGKKKDISSIPYRNIQAFSIKTAGVLDFDCELELVFAGSGEVSFQFTRTTDMMSICKIISEKIF